MKLEGYIIVSPAMPWDKVPFHTKEWTFASTAGEAWGRFLGAGVSFRDQSTYIQRWHDAGYRIKKATLEIEE
jgi:hypothetical protein